MQYGLNDSHAKKDAFFNWLLQQPSSVRLPDAPAVLINLEEYCTNKRLIRKPICDICDQDKIKQLRIRLEGDRLFRFLNRKKVKEMLFLLKCYAQFLEETRAAISESTHKKPEEIILETIAASEDSPATTSVKETVMAEFPSDSALHSENASSDDIIAYFQLNSIPYVDKRPHGGRLWMIGDQTLTANVNALRENGFQFRFVPGGSKSTGGQSAWYLTNHRQTSTLDSQDASECSKSFKLSRELEMLLADDDMQLLRDTLLKQNILSMEQFKQINPWGFMNRHVLYTISQRQEIYKRILQKLRADEFTGSEKHFMLKTATASYPGTIPAEAFACFCEHMVQKYPLKFRSLLDMKYNGQGAIVLSRIDKHGNSIKLMNPEAYVDRQLTPQDALIYGQWICKMCGESELLVKMEEPENKADKTTVKSSPEDRPENTGRSSAVFVNPALEPAASTASENAFIQEAEQLILAADLNGMTMEALRQALHTTMSSVKDTVADSKHIVSLNGKLFHDEAFVDWEDGAVQLEKILDKLLDRNNGYISAAQLYEYAHAEMQMFLNDNDMDDPHMVYDMAQHLFEKLDRHHKQIVFWMKYHISRENAAVRSNLDVMRNYAREHDGFFCEEDLIKYLQRVGIKTGNLRGQMQIYSKPVFLFYDAETYITVESMGIEATWLSRVQEALTRLFADMGDHVVLRDIQPWWYTQLPVLPGGKAWTALLLQNVLMHYSKALNGTRTIGALSTQTANTLHAMVVSGESEIQTFPDAVIAFLVDDEIDQRRFEGEELRQLLARRGLIAGSELFSNMPKALAKDERFAWDASQRYVTVKV